MGVRVPGAMLSRPRESWPSVGTSRAAKACRPPPASQAAVATAGAWEFGEDIGARERWHGGLHRTGDTGPPFSKSRHRANAKHRTALLAFSARGTAPLTRRRRP